MGIYINDPPVDREEVKIIFYRLFRTPKQFLIHNDISHTFARLIPEHELIENFVLQRVSYDQKSTHFLQKKEIRK